MAVIRTSRFDQTHKAVLEEPQTAWSMLRLDCTHTSLALDTGQH